MYHFLCFYCYCGKIQEMLFLGNSTTHSQGCRVSRSFIPLMSPILLVAWKARGGILNLLFLVLNFWVKKKKVDVWRSDWKLTKIESSVLHGKNTGVLCQAETQIGDQALLISCVWPWPRDLSVWATCVLSAKWE